MKIKPNTYYKEYVDEVDENDNEYYIMYTGTTVVYEIARTINNQIYKHNKKIKWDTIKKWKQFITDCTTRLEELTKDDVFLELL